MACLSVSGSLFSVVSGQLCVAKPWPRGQQKGHSEITFPGLSDDGVVGAQRIVVICLNSASGCFLPRNSLLSEIPCSNMQNEGFGQENP